MRRKLFIILSLLLFVGCAYDLNRPIREYVENGFTYYQYPSDEAVAYAHYKKTKEWRPLSGMAYCKEKIIYYTTEKIKQHENRHCFENWHHERNYNRFDSDSYIKYMRRRIK